MDAVTDTFVAAVTRSERPPQQEKEDRGRCRDEHDEEHIAGHTASR